MPAALAELDDRGPFVRATLKTKHIGEARTRRDMHEKADNEFWAALLAGGEMDRARKPYDAALRRAEALGFDYRPAERLADAAIEAF